MKVRVIAIVLLLSPAFAFAQVPLLLVSSMANSTNAPAEQSAAIDRRDQRVMATRTFLNAHPDLKFRNEGWEAYRAGNYELAIQHFRTASGYADKASQAMMAEMLWQGRGVPIDRAMAYAWADLSAERGYPQFIQLREQYWGRMDEPERARAVQGGRTLLPEYADAVARPRIAQFIKTTKQRMRRYAPYASLPKEVQVPDDSGGKGRDAMVVIPAHRFYAPKFWDPGKYQAWQDAQWKDPPKGRVDVGDVEPVRPVEE